jgi:hypothetical protein
MFHPNHRKVAAAMAKSGGRQLHPLERNPLVPR